MSLTGHTTADLVFTGLLLVLHLAALASLGYLLGCYAGRRKFDAAIAAAKREAEEAKAYRNGMHVRNFREMKEQEARAVKAESALATQADALAHALTRAAYWQDQALEQAARAERYANALKAIDSFVMPIDDVRRLARKALGEP